MIITITITDYNNPGSHNNLLWVGSSGTAATTGEVVGTSIYINIELTEIMYKWLECLTFIVVRLFILTTNLILMKCSVY